MTKKYKKCSFCNNVLQVDLAVFLTPSHPPVCQKCFYKMVCLVAKEDTLFSDDSNEES